MKTIEERFWEKVDKGGPGGCWLWTRAKSSYGYGVFRLGRLIGAHLVSYEWAYGPIPKGREVDHRCRNRACVNPDHLRLATRKQNAENRAAAGNSNNLAGVRGVSRNGQGWRAVVCHNGKRYGGTTRRTIEEAAADAVAMRAALFTHTQN